VKVVLSNLEFAIFVYTMDSSDPNIWDSLFEEAFIFALAAKLCNPLSGDKSRAKELAQNAEVTVMKARVADANESPTPTEHIPDWIKARGYAGGDGLEWYDLDMTGTMITGGM
jgi:hypothetical protein